MSARLAFAVTFVIQTSAFPWVARHVGRDPAEMKRSDDLVMRVPGDAATCPFNPNHVPAIGISSKYPYCGATNGLHGFQVCANNPVPANGDTAHQFIAPTSTDIRGPCPGLNTAANHGFLARDGIVTFAELTDAQQNVYGVGYDLAVLLAVLGVGLDGDPITGKLSLGGHNKFEGDTSLTRNDYFTAGGDNFQFNSTLYSMMSNTCQGDFGLQNIAKYRSQRYQQSLNENGNFYYGPKSLLLYGAASFLYELFPSLGNLGPADQTTMDYFFKKELLPPNWFSRVTPYTIPDVALEIFKQYELYPVAFGGNTGKPNSFVGIGQFGPYIGNNILQATPAGVACLLYQLATENIPSSLGGGGGPPTTTLQWAAAKLNPVFANGTLATFACPLAFNNA